VIIAVSRIAVFSDSLLARVVQIQEGAVEVHAKVCLTESQET
jgi:hypothetical protein